MTRIMVIDDEPLICRLLEYQLGGAGYEVRAYQRSHDALLELSCLPPDLILLDVMMPEISGWDLCRQIRSSSQVPIIMLTAKDGDDDVVRGLTGGADDYVGKPFNQAQLVARIEAVLRRAQPQPSRARVGGHTPPRALATAPLATAPLAELVTSSAAPTSPAALATPTSLATTAAAPTAPTSPSATHTPVLMPATVAAPAAPTPPVATARPALPRLGRRLAEARRQRGLSLHDAGQASGVRWEFLQAIENEEFSFVPRSDLRLALRAYGDLLNVDLKPYAGRAARRSPARQLPLTIGMVAIIALALLLVALVM